MEIGVQNELWGIKIIDALIGQGVDYFCYAPGSRSSALALAISKHPLAKYKIHFDERGICFHAVGYGKAQGKAAAVVTTSGTAVGNLLPGIMEASNDRVPLILLTADRPPELRDCSANQTCDQVKLFNNFVRWQCDLPCPNEFTSDRYLASTMNQAVAMAHYMPCGPVHINCMFREPLFSNSPLEKTLKRHVCFSNPLLHPSEDAMNNISEILNENHKGVIVVGSSSEDLSNEIFSISEKLKWPVFADVLSSLRRSINHPSLISHFDPILRWKQNTSIDAVIHFGDRIVSKTLSKWLEKQSLSFYLQVANHPMRQDPSHLVTHRLQASLTSFSKTLLKRLKKERDIKWQNQWQLWNQICHQSLSEIFAEFTHLTEPGLIWELASILTHDWALFLGNSMPIRDANQFFIPNEFIGPIFGNRGVSGIDGNIATACGIAEGVKKPTFAVIGDLTFLHDLNSLAMISKCSFPVILCVVNNGGGGIFSFLPISEKKDSFEEFFATSHNISFLSAANLFGIPHHHLKSIDELTTFFNLQKKKPQSCIMEITTDRTENFMIHQKIIDKIGSCLNSALLPSEILAVHQ